MKIDDRETLLAQLGKRLDAELDQRSEIPDEAMSSYLRELALNRPGHTGSTRAQIARRLERGY